MNREESRKAGVYDSGFAAGYQEALKDLEAKDRYEEGYRDGLIKAYKIVGSIPLDPGDERDTRNEGYGRFDRFLESQ